MTSAVWFYIIYLPDARAVAQEVFPILHDSDEVAMCANRAQTKMILAAMKQFGWKTKELVGSCPGWD